jgi:Rrf2 family protein
MVSANSRLTIATHVVVWMELGRRNGDEWSTSDQLARSVRTNPVVIRRLLGELRQAGLVESRRGAKAGWRLTRDGAEMTLGDVNAAIGDESIYALHRNEPSEICPVAQGIRPALRPIYARVDDAIRDELSRVSIDDVFRATVRKTASGEWIPADGW